MIRLALFGGSFDPVHNGHLHVARQTLKSGLVDGLIFLPNGRHNFKKDTVLLNYYLRYELVRLALEPGMQVWEDDSQGSGFTSELLKALYAKYPDLGFLFVIGSDNLSKLHAWNDFPWLSQNAEFLIIPRPGYPLEGEIMHIIRYQVLEIPPSPVSSTLVRQRLINSESLEGLVPAHLEARIRELYGPLLSSCASK